MGNRYSKALNVIQEGRNPKGVARAFLNAFEEMEKEGNRNFADDPALRLIVAQLHKLVIGERSISMHDLDRCKDAAK